MWLDLFALKKMRFLWWWCSWLQLTWSLIVEFVSRSDTSLIAVWKTTYRRTFLCRVLFQFSPVNFQGGLLPAGR